MSQIVTIAEVLLELGLSNEVTDEERAIIGTSLNRAEGAIRKYLRYDPVQRTRTEFYPQTNNYHLHKFVWEVTDVIAYQRSLTNANSEELQVQHLPIRNVTTLAIDHDGRSGTRDGSFGSETEKVEGSDFWPNYDGVDGDGNSICRDGIVKSVGLWSQASGSIKIIYDAGYTQDEFRGEVPLVDASPIWDAVVQEASRRTKKAFVWQKNSGTGFTSGPLSSEKLGDYSYRIDSTVSNSLFGGRWDLLPETMQMLADYVNWGLVL